MQRAPARKTQQRVLGGEVEKAPLPLAVLGFQIFAAQLIELGQRRGGGAVRHLLLADELVPLPAPAAEGQGRTPADAAAHEIDKALVLPRRDLLPEVRFGGRIGGISARKDVLDVKKAEIVDAVRAVLGDDIAIVGDGIQETTVVQPCPHARTLPAERQHGMQPRRLQRGRRKDGKLQDVRLLVPKDGSLPHGGERA